MEEKTKKISLIATDGFEEAELIYPYYRLKEAGYDVKLISVKNKIINGEHGYPIAVDMGIEEIDEEITESFDGVVLPGGIKNPDLLRREKKVLDFIKALNEKGKLVAAISYAGWLLISSRIIKDRKVTSYYAMRHDMKRPGVKFENSPVVIDGNLITSRMAIDLPDFMKSILEFLK